MSHIFSKLCMRVENDYTNEFPKFQVHKLCWSWDIYIQKCVIFSSWNGYFYILNIFLTNDVIFLLFLIGQSQSVIVFGIGK